MKTTIDTGNTAAPIGPFSHAVIAGKLLYVSAQFACHPVTGQLVLHSILAETTQVMENIKSILASAGLTCDDIIKASIFLRDMDTYEKVNAVYASYFTPPYPARETIAVSGLPMDVNIEISVIAMVPG